MPSAVISQTVREPTTAELTQFIMTGDFTSGAGITIQCALNLLNDSDGSINRRMNFELNLPIGQKNHLQTDIVTAMTTVVSDVETILGVTFV